MKRRSGLYTNELDMLTIKEYTDVYDVLKHEKSEIETVYIALKAFYDYEPNWDIYPEYSVLGMLNDICRIDQHNEQHPNECIALIERKYINSPINKLFLELIRIYVTNLTFLLVLENQPCIKTITDSKEQTAIREQIEALIKDQPYNISAGTKSKSETRRQPQEYPYNHVKIGEVYDFCIETKVISSDVISHTDFLLAVEKADFRTIYVHTEQQNGKTKCKYIISVLSASMGSEWYRDAAHSINTEPSRCSGAEVPSDWKKKAKKLK